MRAFIVLHELDFIPFCIFEFILADATFYAEHGDTLEVAQRRHVFSYVLENVLGIDEALNSFFFEPENVPKLSYSLRLAFINETFMSRMENSDGTGHLTEKGLQTYLQIIRGQSSSKLKAMLKGFTEKVHQMETKTKEKRKQTNSVMTQTTFNIDKGVQVQSQRECGTQTQIAHMIGQSQNESADTSEDDSVLLADESADS